jgi:ferredoxin
MSKRPDMSSLWSGDALLIDEELCLNLRGRTLSCNSCADVCSVDALELTEDAIELNSDACTGCGACLPSCPAGVLRLSGFSPRRFVDVLESKEEAHIHCSASTDKGEGIVIPCHRVLDARFVAAAFASGTDTFHLHGLSHCETCNKGNAIDYVTDEQHRLEQWFGKEAAPQLVFTEEHSEVAGDRQYQNRPQMSRRNFLRFAGMQTLESATQWLVPAEEDDEPLLLQGFYQGEIDRQQPEVYQSLLAEHAAELPWASTELPWRSRTINEDCSACLSCGQRCPTGALLAEENQAGRGISFEPVLCTDCGLCTQICPMNAVEPHPVADVDEVVVPRMLLMYRHQKDCSRCGHSFIPQTETETLCNTCSNEQEIDTEWMAMLEG